MDRVLLEKAVELGEFLYAAFDTDNRIPSKRWKCQRMVRRCGPSAEMRGREEGAGAVVYSRSIGGADWVTKFVEETDIYP